MAQAVQIRSGSDLGPTAISPFAIWLHRRLIMIDKHHVNGVLEEVAAYNPVLVCFDYFDTIVTRRVHPEDTKKLCCERIARIVGRPDSGSALYALRSELEATQCRNNELLGKDLEFRLQELLAAMWEHAVDLQSLPKDHFIMLAQDIEISLECSVQMLDEDIAEVIRQLRRDGHECWLVSDFYLSEVGFDRLLSFHGIADLFSRTVISSETLLTKRSGRLYQQVLAASGLAASEIVMVGDNPVSDVESARTNGLRAIHIDRSQQHSLYERLGVRGNDAAHTSARIREVMAMKSMVFREIALTLHYFVDRLYNSLLSCQATDVFFLAREGQLLKKMFDHFQHTRQFSGSAHIRSHYLEVSRRSTFLPSMRPLEHETFETLFRQYRRISIKEFLASLGLDSLVTALQGDLPSDLNARCEDLPTDPTFHLLLSNALFRDTYEQERTKRRNAFLTYLNGFELAANSHVMHVVDVGWKGTIQDNIYHVLRDCSPAQTAFSKVTGHYVGLVAQGAAGPENMKQGLVFSTVGTPTKNAHVFNENRALFEVVLAANHGSAYSYRTTPTSRVEVIRQEFIERPLFESKIQPLQAHLFELFCTLDEVFLTQVYPAHRMNVLVAKYHARMLLQPEKEEISWFEDVYHVENFGVFERSRFAVNGKRPDFLSKLRFYRALRKSHGQQDLGFWPWLTCFQHGGRWVASRYAAAQLRGITE